MRFLTRQPPIIRAAAIAGLTVIGCIPVVMFFAYTTRSTLLHKAIIFAIEHNTDIPPPSFETDWHNPAQLVIKNFKLGTDIAVESITVDFTGKDLMSGQITRLNIAGPRITVNKTTQSWSVSGYEPKQNPETKAQQNSSTGLHDLWEYLSNKIPVRKADILNGGFVIRQNAMPELVTKFDVHLQAKNTTTSLNANVTLEPQNPARLPAAHVAMNLELGQKITTLAARITGAFGTLDNKVSLNKSNVMRWLSGTAPLETTLTHSAKLRRSKFIPADTLDYNIEIPLEVTPENILQIAPATKQPVKITFEQFDNGLQKIIEPLALQILPHDNAKAAASLDLSTGNITATAAIAPVKSRFSIADKKLGRIVSSQGIFGHIDLVKNSAKAPQLNNAEIRLPALHMPAYSLVFNDLKFAVKPCNKTRRLCAQFSLGKLSHSEKPAVFTPLHAQIDLTPEGQHNYTIKGGVNTQNNALAVEFSGRHNTANHTGFLTTTLLPTEFGNKSGMATLLQISPLGAQTVELQQGFTMAAVQTHWTGAQITGSAEFIAQKLTPVLSGLTADTNVQLGQVATTLDFSILNGKPAGHGEILLENINLSHGDKKVKNINGVIEIESLFPLALKARQKLSVELASVGLPLTHGQASFTLSLPDQVDIHALDFQWGGGTVGVKDVIVPLVNPDTAQATLTVDNVALNDIARLFAIEGLSADGHLKGNIPVRLESGLPVLGNAILETVAPGTLHYSPSSSVFGTGIGGRMMLQALADFNYKSVKMITQAQDSGNINIKLLVTGINPAFYSGHPVTFEMNLRGNLTAIVEQTQTSYEVPDAIKKRMQRFGR